MGMTYVKLFKAPDDGHRYFREYADGRETGKIAVAREMRIEECAAREKNVHHSDTED